jgi:hypothetical protein
MHIILDTWNIILNYITINTYQQATLLDADIYNLLKTRNTYEIHKFRLKFNNNVNLPKMLYLIKYKGLNIFGNNNWYIKRRAVLSSKCVRYLCGNYDLELDLVYSLISSSVGLKKPKMVRYLYNYLNNNFTFNNDHLIKLFNHALKSKQYKLVDKILEQYNGDISQLVDYDSIDVEVYHKIEHIMDRIGPNTLIAALIKSIKNHIDIVEFLCDENYIDLNDFYDVMIEHNNLHIYHALIIDNYESLSCNCISHGYNCHCKKPYNSRYYHRLYNSYYDTPNTDSDSDYSNPSYYDTPNTDSDSDYSTPSDYSDEDNCG